MDRLPSIVDRLEEFYGPVTAPPPSNCFQMILWENIAYLVNDEQRRLAFETLAKRVGLTPEKILAAPLKTLREVAELGGIIRDQRVNKLLTSAKIAQQKFGGDLTSALALPLPKAKKALRQFPGIGEPGAEKILLFCKKDPVLALDSNGLRVLLRLGFGEETKNYSSTYKSVQQAVRLQPDYDLLIRAHLLLRHHGQQTCKRNFPHCSECPVSNQCAYFKRL